MNPFEEFLRKLVAGTKNNTINWKEHECDMLICKLSDMYNVLIRTSIVHQAFILITNHKMPVSLQLFDVVSSSPVYVDIYRDLLGAIAEQLELVKKTSFQERTLASILSEVNKELKF